MLTIKQLQLVIITALVIIYTQLSIGYEINVSQDRQSNSVNLLEAGSLLKNQE